MKRSDVVVILRVPSDPRFLVLVRGAIEGLGTAYGLSAEQCLHIMLAVDEAVSNVMRHAYRGAPDQPIEIRCHGRADLLEFTILDQGEPPDPERLRAHPPDELALGGRGMLIIHTVMDEITYDSAASGNQLKLRKLLPPKAESSGQNIPEL